MKLAIFTIKGMSVLQHGKAYDTEKKKEESHSAYEERTWMDRAHVDSTGNIYHPAGALKQALICAAKKDAQAVSGKGKCQWKGFFESGVMIPENLKINKTKDDIVKVSVFGNSRGMSNGQGGSRVWKHFPTYYDWEAQCKAVILDETITEAKFKEILEYAGKVAGLGVWRAQNGGENGRFIVTAFKWQDYKG